jgi:hypothetical protein
VGLLAERLCCANGAVELSNRLEERGLLLVRTRSQGD